MKTYSTIQFSSFLLGALLLCSCNAMLHQPMQVREARLGEQTQFNEVLRNLPTPKEKVVVAVYKFRDQTGQYKPSETGANWSTAITQGGTNILIKALDDSGWFLPIERENVSNLLNERKIIRSSRQQFSDEEKSGSYLPPLLFAGIILEGGIVSYDANIMTGGIGVRYFGTGGGGQYRQDRVTVYLRAVSTRTGKVLKTVYTSKTVLSQGLDFGVFRFVSFNRLLEAETGVTYNEPAEMAVTEAIEKAVHSLVMEGLEDALWQATEEEEAVAAKALFDYKKEREKMRQIDVLGHEPMQKNATGVFSASASSFRYEGDYGNALMKGGYDASVDLFVSERLSFGLTFGSGQLESENVFNRRFSYFDLTGKYRLLPENRFTPLVMVGAGTMATTLGTNPFEFQGANYYKLSTGVGVEYFFNQTFGVHLSLDNNYLLDDGVDDMVHGKYNDYYWRTRVGLIAYFGQR